MGSVGNSKSFTLMNGVKNSLIQKALNSRFKGVQRDAQEGTGNYSFKDASPVSENQAFQMTSMNFREHEGNTLVYGLVGDKKVFFVAPSDSSVIKNLQERATNLKKNNISGVQRPEIRTTTTYDKWRKRNKANFDAWFGKR